MPAERGSAGVRRVLLLAVLYTAFLLPLHAQTTPYLVVLGIAQDGGVPQAGSYQEPGWDHPAFRRHVVSLGLVDPAGHQRWLFEATPDFRAQLHAIIRDMAALSSKYHKPLSARLFPVPGKRAGQAVHFDNPFLTDSVVMHAG